MGYQKFESFSSHIEGRMARWLPPMAQLIHCLYKNNNTGSNSGRLSISSNLIYQTNSWYSALGRKANTYCINISSIYKKLSLKEIQDRLSNALFWDWYRPASWECRKCGHSFAVRGCRLCENPECGWCEDCREYDPETALILSER